MAKDATKHLAPIARDGLIAWSDEQIKIGAMWSDQIKAALAEAKVAILLISPDFLDSNLIVNKELLPLPKVAEEEGPKILWIPIEHCLYKYTDIANYQAVYSPARPLATLEPDELDEALVAICRAIAAAIEGNQQGLVEA